jgi:uncharacterized protein YciI
MKYVLFYVPADNATVGMDEHFPAYRARLRDFHHRGMLLMSGNLGDPYSDGAMSVFTTWEAAEEFARDDPFVTSGAVQKWYIRAWNEFLTPEP